MIFEDERKRAHYGYWYEGVTDHFLKRLPVSTLATLGEVTLHLHDPDLELETAHHKDLLYVGSANPTTLILYPRRIEQSTKDDEERFDLTISCLTKATNDLTRWRPKHRIK